MRNQAPNGNGAETPDGSGTTSPGIVPNFVPEGFSKRCSCCKATKPRDQFPRNARHLDGLSYRCKDCKRVGDRASYLKHREKRFESSRRWNAANPEKRREIANNHARRKYAPVKAAVAERRAAEQAARLARTHKYCPGCGATLPVEAFWRNRKEADGRQHSCRDCRSKENKARYEADIDAARARGLVAAKRWRANNLDAAKAIVKRCHAKLRSEGRLNHQTLSDGYIATVLQLPLAIIPAEVLQAKRAHLAVKRELEARRARLTAVGLKPCPRCKAALPAEAYYVNRSQRDGLSTYCRPCKSVRDKQYRQNRKGTE